MTLEHLGKNGVQEFFEELIYGKTYEEVHTSIASLSGDLDDSVMQDAVQGSLNVVASGLIMTVISKVETFVEYIFDLAKTLIVALIGSDFVQRGINRLSGIKGFRALKKLSFFQTALSDRVQVAHLVNNVANNHFTSQKVAQNEVGIIQSVNQLKSNVIQKEQFNMNFANNLATRYSETFLPKLMTGSFVASDIPTLKKVFGRDTESEMRIEDLNKVSEFMFVKDSQGEVHGLTDIMISLLNGLGYVHNKN